MVTATVDAEALVGAGPAVGSVLELEQAVSAVATSRRRTERRMSPVTARGHGR